MQKIIRIGEFKEHWTHWNIEMKFPITKKLKLTLLLNLQK